MSNPPPQLARQTSESALAATSLLGWELEMLRILGRLDDAVTLRLANQEICSEVRPLAPAGEAPAEVCGVCYDDLKDPIKSLCGRHIFCRGCILVWLKNSPSCPTCRYDSKDLMAQVIITAREDILEAGESMRDIVHDFDLFRDVETGLLDVELSETVIDAILGGWAVWHHDNIRRGLMEIAVSDPNQHWYLGLMREQVYKRRSTGVCGDVQSQKPDSPLDSLEDLAQALPSLMLPEEDLW